ncbi:MAG: 16S rRNA (uracil(1498)-N(3))-methyltransferase [Bacteroidales bacterium]
MNPVFYLPELIRGEYFLPEEEAWHAIKVLRLRRGDAVTLVDGKGNRADAVIAEIKSNTCLLGRITNLKESGKRPVNIHLAIAPTKQIERFEFFLEKATEIGIDRITPLLCSNSERQQIRTDRLNKVLIAAMKQSLKSTLPVLDELTRFNDFIQMPGEYLKTIAHCREGEKKELARIIKGSAAVQILIGPEGDFTREEIQAASQSGYISVSLGESRLRTETAGIVAVHTIQLLNPGGVGD